MNYKKSSRYSLINYLSKKFHANKDAFLNSVKQLLATPVKSLITVLVICSSLLLPAVFFLISKNFAQFGAHLNATAQVSLYLKSDLTAEQIATLQQKIKNIPGVIDTRYISPAQGLTELTQTDDMQKIINQIKQNPLPPVLVLKLELLNDAKIQQLISQLKTNVEIETLQMDKQWLKRLVLLLQLSQHILYALSIIFIGTILLVIGNTIDSSTQRAQQEIEIYQMIGATHSFIRRPFLYTGTLLGLIGGLGAVLFIALLTHDLNRPLQQLAQSYGTEFKIDGFTLHNGFILISCSMFLGWIAAFFAFHKKLFSY